MKAVDEAVNMEVEDEAADMDTLSMSIQELVPAQPDSVGNVTITINSMGEINVDQSALTNILDSGQQSARVNFVRVGEEGAIIENQVDLDVRELLAAVGGQVDADLGPEDGGSGGGPGSMLQLDQDQMMKLERVLQSDEAKNILGDINEVSAAVGSSKKVFETVSKMEEQQEAKVGPIRRGQIQVDRETRQKAEKLRAENQEIMRIEDDSIKVKGPVVAVGRGKSRGKGGMMRGGSRSWPKRETRVPRHLASQELSSPPVSDSDSDDAGSWASEDDPDRLWCVCQQPHNNRFMICCDICLDWFHGKCVGITKGQGKVMEEAGQDWKCPPCLAGMGNSSATDNIESIEAYELDAEEMEGPDDISDKKDEDLLDAEEMEGPENISDKKDEDLKDAFVSPPSTTKNVQAPSQPRSRGSRKSSCGGNQELEKKEKVKVPTCHMCTNLPRESSIYCSEECIKAHANQALSLLTEDGKKSKASNPVVVLETKTNTLLNGPNAPTEGSLQTWLQAHTSFHVVLPRKPSSSRFYSSGSSHRTPKVGPKLIAPHRETPDKKSEKKFPGPAYRISFMEALQRKPVKTKEEMVAETKATLRRAISSHDSGRPAKKERRSSESVERKQPVVRRKQDKLKVEHIEVKEVKTQDNKSLRSMVVKGIRDSLAEKLEKCSDLNMEASIILKVAEEVEIAMFGTFGEVGSKYKNKYRSLTYNIKDPKNDGLFRRILLRDLSPIEVVGMSADEYASKELQQWRKQEAKKDIEAIKLHELDMLALGNTYVMKSHKGEQVIEKSELTAEVTPSSSGPVLPEDIPVIKDTRGEGLKEVTWDHPNHGDLTTEPLCDVCNGKMSLEDFVSAKVSREEEIKKSGDRSRRSDKDRKRHHSSSKSHSSRVKHSSSSKSHSSSSKDKSHSSSSKDKSRSGSSSHRSSRDKSHSSSSNSKSHSSSSKEKSSRSSSSKDKSHTKSSKHSSSREKKQSGSREDDEKPHSSSKSLKPNSKSAAVYMEAEKVDLQARINRATAAIEAAKKSTNEPWGPICENSSQEEVVPGSPPELDLDIPDYDGVEKENGRRYSSGGDGEVSSTVTIATPEQWEMENHNQEPSVWEGQVIMQDVANFSVSAYQVSGTSDYLRVDLKTSLTLVGRIPPSVCWDYIEKISKNPTKEILVLRLGPSNIDDRDSYQEFYKYLHTKDRFGVVGNANKLVKDCYIMPLSSESPVPSSLLPLSGQGLPPSRSDLLLTIIIRTKRVRPGQPPPAPPPLVKPGPRLVEPLVPSLPLDPGSSTYSPPGSSPEYPLPDPSPQKDSPAFKPKTSNDGGFTEKLAKLQAEVAAKREELKKREAVLSPPEYHTPAPHPIPNLPMFTTDVAQSRPGLNTNMMGQQTNMIGQGSSNMLGQGSISLMGQPPNMMLSMRSPSGQSSHSMLSDADLLSKAQSMQGARLLPPPGLVMPGNLLGQGVSNLELQREEERGEWDRGENRSGRGFRGRGGREWDRKGDNWDNRRDFGDWGDRGIDRDRRDSDWRDRRGGGRRDSDRDRDWGGGEWNGRGGRNDFERGNERRKLSERSRDSDSGSRGGGWRKDNVRCSGGPDWNDYEHRGDSSDFHRNIAAELANFDKQYLPPGGQHQGHHGDHHLPH